MEDAIAMGGGMEETSIRVKQAANGGYIVSRSWDEKNGKDTKYMSEELFFDELPAGAQLKSMFRPGPYKKDRTARDNVADAYEKTNKVEEDEQ